MSLLMSFFSCWAGIALRRDITTTCCWTTPDDPEGQSYDLLTSFALLLYLFFFAVTIFNFILFRFNDWSSCKNCSTSWVTRTWGGSRSIFPSWQFFQDFFPLSETKKYIYHSTHERRFTFFFILSIPFTSNQRHDFLSPSNFQQFPFHWTIGENSNNFPTEP